MLCGKRVVVVLPAFNAENTLPLTMAGLDRSVVDNVVLVDDASTDGTLLMARSLGLEPTCHESNRGYGGNQKTCYAKALELGADVIVMVHPDYQYSPRLVPAMAAMVVSGEYDLVLGSRILAQNAMARGMPAWRFLSNRALTFIENLFVGAKLSEYHTGLRAYSRELLAVLPVDHNSDDFTFDNQVIVQSLAAGGRIGELSCPTRYQPGSSSIGFRASVRYGVGVLRTAVQYRLWRMGVRKYAYLTVPKLSADDRGAYEDTVTKLRGSRIAN
jgi:glycosyltransferase involved in cell wall biosynthesis